MHRMLAILFVVAAPSAAQNLVTNGGFERTKTTGCAFNLTNSEFGEAMPGCTGFGTWQGVGEIDIMQGSACGYGLPAASGRVKVGIGAAGDDASADALSFRLKVPVVPGGAYRLSFKANAYVSKFSPQIGAVEVGLSQSATTFGDKVGELVPSAIVWSSFDAIIEPTAVARFLTVRYPTSGDGWNHVDDFALVEVAIAADLSVDAGDSTIHVKGATPGSLVALLISSDAGSIDGLAGITCVSTLAALLRADDMGAAALESGRLPGATLHLQAVDLFTGAVSPVAAMDECPPEDTGQLKSASPTMSWDERVAGSDELGACGPSPPTAPH